MWVPYPRNPFFTGRENVLRDMATALAKRGRVALAGLGGMGKTQTALEYVYRHQEEYDFIGWMRAEQTADLITGYGDLAKALQLPGCHQEDVQAVARLMQRWLAQHERWLLVLDNADDLGLVRPYLPPVKGHIVLTTRAQATGDLAERLEILRLDPPAGALLLLRRAKVIPDDANLAAATAADVALAHELNTAMDGLPLALDQAGAYIEEQVLSLAEYLELFQTEKAALLAERGQLAPDHPSVTVTFTLAFNQVAAANPAAADLMRVCAFLAPDDIPEELFQAGAAALGASLSALAENTLALKKAMAAATRFSLMSRNPQRRTLTLHRLVQVVLQGLMTGAEQRQWAERVVAAVTAIFPNAEYANWGQCDRLLPHAQAVLHLIADQALESETAALLHNRVGYYLYEQGRYSEAEPLHLQALEIARSQLGAEHPNTASSLNNLAALYESQGRYGEAEPLYLQALEITRLQLGANHPDTATSLNNLAEVYRAQGRYSEAEPLYLQALEITRLRLGANHLDTATSLNNLAGLYRAQGRYSEAEPLYLQALEIRQSQLGADHPDTANSLNNLAALYESQGRYGEAEPLLQEALEIRQSQLGREHPDTATSLNNLAFLYYAQGRYGEAEPLLQEALEIRRSQLGAEHPDTATSLNNLAGLYYAQGRYGEAEPLLLEALPILIARLGEGHPTIQTVQKNFVECVAAALAAGQAESLSAHPTTQAVLAQLRQSP